MNPFKKIRAQETGNREPVYCSVDGCMRYMGHGQYARSFADKVFTNTRGERVQLCDRHYCEGLDACGHSVMAQLLRDPDSIPSRMRAHASEITGANEGDDDHDAATN